DDDVYRLERHVYPVVGNVPLVEFTLEHAEDILSQMPRKLSATSRRHVAQLVHRVLRLAAYPCRLIQNNPIPRGFLPKPAKSKAMTYLYPDEDSKLMARVDIPLVYRLAYGLLAREGLRSSELALLALGDVDLERG